MNQSAVTKWCSRPEATDHLIAALILYHRSGWAVPGPMKEGRASHLCRRLTAYLAWYQQTHDTTPAASHLSVATDVMIAFSPSDGRVKATANPWVLDSEFPMISSLVEQCLATLPRDVTTLTWVKRPLGDSDKDIEQ